MYHFQSAAVYGFAAFEECYGKRFSRALKEPAYAGNLVVYAENK